MSAYIIGPGEAIACRELSAGLTVCRALPHSITTPELFFGVLIMGILLALWGTVAVYLDEVRHARKEGRKLPRLVPKVHYFPPRSPGNDRED